MSQAAPAGKRAGYSRRVRALLFSTAWLVILVTGSTARSADPGSTPLHAERITPARLEALRVPGPDSDAGVGDWALGNGTLCAAISDADHEGHLGLYGGTLIDLGRCGSGADQWSSLQPLYDLSPDWQLPVTSIQAESDDDAARIVVVAEDAVLRATTTFSVGVEPRGELRVRHRVERIGEGDRLFAVGSVTLLSGAQLRPFSLSLEDPESSRGFVHPEVDTGSIPSLLSAVIPVDAHVLVGGDRIEPGLAYGIRIGGAWRERPEREPEPVPTLTVTGADFALHAALAAPPWLGSDHRAGLLELAQMPFMDVDPGEALVFEQVVWLGERADVASVSDALFADGPRVSGQVDDPRARIHVDRPSGAPLTEVRPEADGHFAFRLAEAGPVVLRAVAPGGRAKRIEVEVPAEGVRVEPIELGTPARLRLPREWMRIALRGEGDTPDPLVGDDLLGLMSGERPLLAGPAASVVSLAGVPSDPTEVVLPPGRYRALATRGPEYTVSIEPFELAAGGSHTLRLEPPVRAAETPGWLATELHLHSAESFDSSFPMPDQLRAFAAQGVEWVVATEHDRVVDPAPVIAALGLGGRMVGVPGVEVTTTVGAGEAPYTIGHENVFPWPPEPGAYRGGAPPAEGQRLRDLAHRVRSRDSAGPSPLLQLNHARANDGRTQEDLYFLSHLGVVGEPYEPWRPLSEEPNRVLLEPDPEHGLRDLDFDAMELLNGTERGRYPMLRADWVSLLLQGERITATANSDSHDARETPGLPRTYVRVDGTGADTEGVVAALRAGRAYGTSGPLLDATLGEAGIGDTFVGSAGTLAIHVQAAPWVPVDELRVLVNGERVHVEALQGGGRFEVPLTFERDAFVTVEVEGAPRGLYALIHPGLLPLAFSNPIWVDADGDGAWTAPGLPRTLPWAIQQVR